MSRNNAPGGASLKGRFDVRWMIAIALLVAACDNGNNNSCPKSSSLGQTKDKVDILFMVDDSPSTTPKQAELQARFPELIKVLDQMGATGNPIDYHIGVVTSDLGAGPTPFGNCTPGGLGAKLQSLGRAHGAACAPPIGANFIEYNQLSGENNLPTGVTLADEFTCMAQVGAAGCGFEHPLEAVYKALHDCMPDASGAYPNCTIPENRGFLRPDSVLVVVLVTDEDDCSADPTTDLFAINKTSSYGNELSYRCTNYGIECLQNGSEQLMPYGDSGGALTGCQSAPNPNGTGPGKLYDLSRYLNFFTMPASAGGVRDNPGDVILAAIDAPSTPVESFVGNPSTYAPCAAGSTLDGQKCAVLLQHSCNASAQFFGDPAVRINQLVNASAGSLLSSICDQDYTAAMTALGQQIGMRVMGIAPTTGTTGTSGATTGTSGATTGTTGGTSSCGSGGKVDNVAACQSFVKKVQCGSTDVSQYVDCSSYANVTCDISDYFSCIEPKFVCANGMYDPTQLSTLSDCASKATCP
jgi:hypothetical protein